MLLREKYQAKHHHRKRILEENLLQYRDRLVVSERNKEIVEMYVKGSTYAEVGKKYGISGTRVEQIVHGYIRHCVLLGQKYEPYDVE